MDDQLRVLMPPKLQVQAVLLPAGTSCASMDTPQTNGCGAAARIFYFQFPISPLNSLAALAALCSPTATCGQMARQGLAPRNSRM